MFPIAESVPPRIRLWTRAVREWHRGEPELRLLRRLCRDDRAAVDVGANYGVYSWFLTKYALRVTAFEPQPRMVRFLKSAFGSSVQVEPVALSDRSGTSRMRIPSDRYLDGRATIEAENRLLKQDCEEIDVSTRRLDDYDLDAVGFIKIDVEGHELQVLKGAERILQRDRPNLIVEAEECHRANAISSVVEYLRPFGYGAYCLRDGKVRALSERELHGSTGLYNYIFSTTENL